MSAGHSNGEKFHAEDITPSILKQSKKHKHGKTRTENHSQMNRLANVGGKKDEISSNWKVYQKHFAKVEKNSATHYENKDKLNGFSKNKFIKNGTGIQSSVHIKPLSKRLGHFDAKKITKVVAMDCEMVGIDTGKDSMLARVSLVNKYGNCIYDKYVLPSEPVVDYRTRVSGIRPNDLRNGESFETVQKEVAEILRDRILVGHALKNDLQVLFLSHPRKAIRDTSRYKPFRKVTNGSTPSLRKLAEELLGVKIQQGEHDSVVDAKTTMQLYLLYRKEWEKGLFSKYSQSK